MGKVTTKLISKDAMQHGKRSTAELFSSTASRGYVGFKDHEVLSEVEIQALIERYQKTGDIQARNSVIEHNMKIIWFVCRQYVPTKSPEFFSVYNEAILDFQKAIDRFDLTKARTENIKFTSYAVWWIRRAVTNYFSNIALAVKLPVGTLRELRATRIAYLEETAPNSHELVTLKKRQLSNHTYDAGSFIQSLEINEESITYDSDTTLDDTYPSGTVTMAAQDRNSLLTEAFGNLTNREQQVIEMLFALNGSCKSPMTCEAVGKLLDPSISKERVRQLRDQGFVKIRKCLKAKNLTLHDIV